VEGYSRSTSRQLPLIVVRFRRDAVTFVSRSSGDLSGRPPVRVWRACGLQLKGRFSPVLPGRYRCAAAAEGLRPGSSAYRRGGFSSSVKVPARAARGRARDRWRGGARVEKARDADPDDRTGVGAPRLDVASAREQLGGRCTPGLEVPRAVVWPQDMKLEVAVRRELGAMISGLDTRFTGACGVFKAVCCRCARVGVR